MKGRLLLSVFLLSLPLASFSVHAEEYPAWLKEKAQQKKFARAVRYEYKGAFYYRISYFIPDAYESLYDSGGRYVCAPSGGFSGRGDRKCPDFVKDLGDATAISKEALTDGGSKP